ncbi:MAG: hypothetical protein EBR82_63110, partial [Caulobacteraceae bacterium]|nr:hypothetical protein [Caulobacteraceae bacterium]
KIILKVKGYKGIPDFRALTDGEKATMRAGHKKTTVDHILREPTESERAKFKRNASKVSFIRGAKRPRTKIGADLRAYVEMYDQLVTDVEGGTVRDKGFADSERGVFLAAIDPTWKRLIVQTLMAALEASLLD